MTKKVFPTLICFNSTPSKSASMHVGSLTWNFEVSPLLGMYNKHSKYATIFERIDKVLINANCKAKYLNAWLKPITCVSLNHAPICLSSQFRNQYSRRPFHFKAMWLTRKDLWEVVVDVWPSLFDIATSNDARVTDIWEKSRERGRVHWSPCFSKQFPNREALKCYYLSLETSKVYNEEGRGKKIDLEGSEGQKFLSQRLLLLFGTLSCWKKFDSLLRK